MTVAGRKPSKPDRRGGDRRTTRARRRNDKRVDHVTSAATVANLRTAARRILSSKYIANRPPPFMPRLKSLINDAVLLAKAVLK